MSVRLENNAAGILLQGINASATQVQLQQGDGEVFPLLGPGEFFYATLVSTNGKSEIVLVTARVGDIFVVTRAQERTKAQSFSSGSRFELRVTVGNIKALIPEPQIIISSTPPPNPSMNQLWLEID